MGNRDREQNAKRMRERRADGANIGPPPKIQDQVRRDACEFDLKLFCETYRADAFNMGWSPDHLEVIKTLEDVILKGGQYGLAMPRGSGKSTLSITAAIWAKLYGHRKYTCIIAATGKKACELLNSIKTELRYNDLLYADFPEVCHPIRSLEGRATRAIGQTIDGVATNMSWLSDRLVLPTVEGSRCSNSVISVAGITGDIRGQQESLASGGVIRPDCCIIDDPQTRESAYSESQTKQRLETIMGDIMGLAGPGKRIACIIPFTVVAIYDLADRILRGDEFSQFKTKRSQMLYGKPANPERWEEYRNLRDELLKNSLDLDTLNDFYEEHREELDAGLKAAWNDRKYPDEVSAIQHAMNLMYTDYAAFMCEYQNQPVETEADSSITEAECISRIIDSPEGIVPDDTEKIVMFSDVQKECLYYIIVAIRSNFSGHIVEYGIWPEQRDRNIRLRNLRTTLSDLHAELTWEDRLRVALHGLKDDKFDATFSDSTGTEYGIDSWMIDANWGASTETIYDWINQFCKGKRVFPSHGKFVGASSKSLNDNVARKPGVTIGVHWRTDFPKNSRVKYVLYDTNFWKTFAIERLKMVAADSRGITLPKGTPRNHTGLISNLCSEYPVKVEGRGRTVDEWKLKPGADNHWLDGLVACMVQGSMLGVQLPGEKKRRAVNNRRRNQGDGGNRGTGFSL